MKPSLIWLMVLAALPAGGSTHAATPARFPSESRFIVQTIVADLAEQVFYGATGRLPDRSAFSVTVVEEAGSPPDAPVFQLRIRLGPKWRDLDVVVKIDGPIWSPVVYRHLTGELAHVAGLKPRSSFPTPDSRLLAQLLKNTPTVIEQQNQALSAALQQDFTNPELHEQAALLLGTFLFRDSSGLFFEIRSSLCRLSAHLAMAQLLRGDQPWQVNGQLAQAMLLTLVNNEALALEQLDTLAYRAPEVTAIVRALRACTTGDFRPLEQVQERSPLESVAWFGALAGAVGDSLAWPKLSDAQQETIDFARIADQHRYSVAIGHRLLAIAIPLELEEIEQTYELSHHAKLSREGMVQALNEPPEACLARGAGGEVQVRVLGWGQWAAFLQRHLCHAIQQNYYFIRYSLRAPEAANEFATRCEREFGGLYLYPFIRRINCSDADSYRKSVGECLQVIIATPYLVPSECWNYVFLKSTPFAPFYQPTSKPYLKEWRDHYPLPGTAYNVPWDNPTLLERPDLLAQLEKLQNRAPYDLNILSLIMAKKYGGRASYDQARALYGPVLPYSVLASRAVADTVADQPELYEKLMTQAAQLDPANYYTLGQYASRHHEEDKAAAYYERACQADPDAVRVSNHAPWRVRYYLKKGQTEKARQIAEGASAVYSGGGLTAKATFLEATADYEAAFTWFAKIEERYNDPSPLIDFCIRYREQTGDSRFDPELQKRMPKLFPDGLAKVSLSDFQGPPAEGVQLMQQNRLVLSAGLRQGSVIVALNGFRLRNLQQYAYLLSSRTGSELDLIVWQTNAYHEIRCNPPKGRFGVEFGNYRPDSTPPARVGSQ